MCEQNDELYDSFYTDDEDEDDIYGELTPIENWRRESSSVNFDNMTASELIQETRNPHAIGSCCTATSILMNSNIRNDINSNNKNIINIQDDIININHRINNNQYLNRINNNQYLNNINNDLYEELIDIIRINKHE